MVGFVLKLKLRYSSVWAPSITLTEDCHYEAFVICSYSDERCLRFPYTHQYPPRQQVHLLLKLIEVLELSALNLLFMFFSDMILLFFKRII